MVSNFNGILFKRQEILKDSLNLKKKLVCDAKFVFFQKFYEDFKTLRKRTLITSYDGSFFSFFFYFFGSLILQGAQLRYVHFFIMYIIKSYNRYVKHLNNNILSRKNISF